MKVLAYMPLHYGAEYLDASLKSINNHVDKIIILHTTKPSYGFATNKRCPESHDMLLDIALKASDKMMWYSGEWGEEGAHRKYIQTYSADYDLTLAIDADEVWDEDSLDQCLELALKSKARHIGITGFINFWKSFEHACYDGFAPVRITNNANKEGTENFEGKVYHMSCFQSLKIMRYKWAVHGHRDELRATWWEKYFKDDLEDIHPVAENLWNAVEFDKTTLPELLKNHPNYAIRGIDSR